MKKLFICIAVLCLSLPSAWGNSVNVLILKHAPQVNLTFLKNYAIVVGENFYGPISAQNQLRITSSASGMRLLVYNSKTKVHKSLGTTKEPIHIVRSLGSSINFNWPQPLASLQKKPLSPFLKWQSFPPQEGGFVSLRQAAYGGDITYNGPLTVYLKSGINVVETADLEEYVTQVVNCELGAEKSLQALKAQSVLVRTFALYMVQYRLRALDGGNPNWRFFQLFSTPKDQAYNCHKRADDLEPPNDLVKKAVQETAGQVLLKDNELARVQYNTGAAKDLPKGVISQEELIKKAHAGKSYTAILKSFIPGSTIERYNLSDLCARAVKALFLQKK